MIHHISTVRYVNQPSIRPSLHQRITNILLADVTRALRLSMQLLGTWVSFSLLLPPSLLPIMTFPIRLNGYRIQISNQRYNYILHLTLTPSVSFIQRSRFFVI